MLVIDDFNELEFLESLLRRLGFDVLSLNKDVSVPSAILGFFPDLIVAQAKSRAVDGVVLSQKVRKLAPQARMVLLHPIGQPPRVGAELKQSVDAFLEMPVDTTILISMLSQLGSLDENMLREKMNRFAASKMSDEKRSRMLGSRPQATQDADKPNMVSGDVGKRLSPDLVHVTSKSSNSSSEPVITQSGPRASGGANIIAGSGSAAEKTASEMSASANSSQAASVANQGIHHFQGDNKLKGATHISGERNSQGPAHIAGERTEQGAAYDPTGSQAGGKEGAAYLPSSNTGTSATSPTTRKALIENAEVTARTKAYDEFLAAHDEPVDRVLPQGEMRREAKRLKLDIVTPEDELEAKRSFVRALFRK